MTFGVMLWYCAVLQIVPDLVICAVAALLGSGPTGSVFGSSKKGKRKKEETWEEDCLLQVQERMWGKNFRHSPHGEETEGAWV